MATVSPATKDIFTASPLVLTFHRDDKGFVSGCSVDSGRVRNIAFIRETKR